MALTFESLTGYMNSRFGLDTADFDESTPLFSSNLLDSFTMVDLIAFVESQAGIRMDVWDVTLDNLDSIGQILNYVRAKKPA